MAEKTKGGRVEVTTDIITPKIAPSVCSSLNTPPISQYVHRIEYSTESQQSAILDIEKGFVQQDTTVGERYPRSSIPGSSTTDVEDPNLVDWDGDDDPANPQNWKRRRKWAAIALVSAFTFMSPVASSILAPSLQSIGEDLNIESDSEKSLCLSIFVLGFALGPLILAPLSEIYGRAIILQSSNLLFIIFNCACGFAKSKEQLIMFRFLAGLGGSSPLALGSGVLSDLFTADERGLAVGIYSFFPILGPAIGPICGGFITEYSSWRWAFWATTLADVPILFLGTVLLEETYAPVLLLRKKMSLLKQSGNLDLFTRYEVPGQTFAKKMGEALVRPMVLIGTQPIIILMGLYQAYLYGLMYIVLTTYPKLWRDVYHQSVSLAGLNYISLGIGYCVGIQVSIFEKASYNQLTCRIRCVLVLKIRSTATSKLATTTSDVLNFGVLSCFQ